MSVMKRMKFRLYASLGISAAIGMTFGVLPCGFGGSETAYADSMGRQNMYRLYNPNSGEHFYTANGIERDQLVYAGWRYEGIGWVAPVRSAHPVYRLYNPYAGDHHYTLNGNERNMLVRQGWRYEGIGWYSADRNRAYPLYRQYNPRAVRGTHNYTLNGNERNMLLRAGWRDEGIAWYGIGPGKSAPVPQYLRPSGGAYPNLNQVVDLNIEVSIAKQRVYVKNGPRVIYTMIASTGVANTTPRGKYYVTGRGASFYNPNEGMGANYWVQWYGDFLFHSVPTDANGRYIISEANKLGHPASHGCVRLSIPDAQWFYRELPNGTPIWIH